MNVLLFIGQFLTMSIIIALLIVFFIDMKIKSISNRRIKISDGLKNDIRNFDKVKGDRESLSDDDKELFDDIENLIQKLEKKLEENKE